MSSPFLGEIRILAYDFPTKGWARCDGQLLSIASNSALFSLLGTFYGGNGTTNFALPNLQGRQPIHFGTGPGLTTRTIGQSGGSAGITLLANQMPVHNHAVAASTTGTVNVPGAGVYGASTDNLYADPVATNKKAEAGGPMAAGALGSTGGNQPHENRMPGLVLNVCIALQGIFPSRN